MAGNMFGGGGMPGFPGTAASGSGSAVEAVEDDEDDDDDEMPSLVSEAEYVAAHGGVDTASVPVAVPAAAPAPAVAPVSAPGTAASRQFEDNPVFQRFLANVKSRGFFEGTTEGDEGVVGAHARTRTSECVVWHAWCPCCCCCRVQTCVTANAGTAM